MTLPMDKRDPGPTVGRDEAKKEWLQSWHKGEAYATQSEYKFWAQLQSVQNEDPSGGRVTQWLKRWTADVVAENMPIVETGFFEGKSLVKTFVCHEQPRLRLIRDYQYVMSDGTWGAAAVPSSETIRAAIGNAVVNDTLGRENRHKFYRVLKWTNPVASEILSTWGETGWEISAEWLKKNIGQFDAEGRLNIPDDSLIAEKFGAKDRAEIIAQAVAISSNANGRKVAIAQDGKYWRRTKEIQTVKSSSADPHESVEAFDSYLEQGIEANPDLQGLVKRESFSMTRDLFDADIRKPGDVWVVDGEFFNSFLHPDLKGAFQGRAVVKYVQDEEGDEAYISVPSLLSGQKKSYAIRKLEVLPQGKVDGAMVSTDLVYDERPVGGRFWAKYERNKSDIFILVDKESGHVVYSKTRLVSDDVGALPMLALLDGFKAAGKGTLELTFTGEVYTLEELAGDAK